jgi:hypothetical protein
MKPLATPDLTTKLGALIGAARLREQAAQAKAAQEQAERLQQAFDRTRLELEGLLVELIGAQFLTLGRLLPGEKGEAEFALPLPDGNALTITLVRDTWEDRQFVISQGEHYRVVNLCHYPTTEDGDRILFAIAELLASWNAA